MALTRATGRNKRGASCRQIQGGPHMAGQPETGSRGTTRAVRPTPGRAGDAALSVPNTTRVVFACRHPSANDTSESKSDSHSLVDFVDALAEFTADLLSRGQLDDLLPESDLNGLSDRRIAFTSAEPPAHK